MQRSDLRRDNGMPFTLDCVDELDLSVMIEVVETALALIICRRGPAGYPIARGLVDRLYDLCCRATDQRPRRSFGHPRGVKLCAAGGVETGWFLTFCRAVLAAIEQGQPYAGVGHRNLAKIVRTVIDERKATQAQATDQTGRDQIF